MTSHHHGAAPARRRRRQRWPPGESLTTAFGQHPDAQIITSFPGLGTVLSARILAEIGDDRTRFATARGLKAFAGTAPITRASAMKQAPRPDRLLVGPADDRSVTRRAGPLHCPARTRGQLQRRRPQPRQPRHRDAAPLLADSSALRREEGILSCQPATPGKPPASQACQRGRGHTLMQRQRTMTSGP